MRQPPSGSRLAPSCENADVRGERTRLAGPAQANADRPPATRPRKARRPYGRASVAMPRRYRQSLDNPAASAPGKAALMRTILIALGVLALTPAAAHATTVAYAPDGALVVTAGPGEKNHVGIQADAAETGRV